MRQAISELFQASRDRSPPDTVVLRAARAVAAVARRDGLEAEEMIRSVKNEWVELAGSARPTDEPLRETQNRLISECIRVYYDGVGA